MPVGLGPRFLIEAGFIVAVAVIAGIQRYSTLTIVLLVGAAWLLVALGEWLLSRRERELPRGASPGARHLPGTEPAEVDTPRPAPAPALELTPEPEAEPQPVPLAPSLGARHVPGTEPAEVDTPPEAERVVQLPARTEPCEWNLWELERVARDRAGDDVARDEERTFLLMYLREFANSEGVLPADFDGVVRESFGDVLDAAYS